MFYCWGCGEVQKGVRLTLVARVKWYLFFLGSFFLIYFHLLRADVVCSSVSVKASLHMLLSLYHYSWRRTSSRDSWLQYTQLWESVWAARGVTITPFLLLHISLLFLNLEWDTVEPTHTFTDRRRYTYVRTPLRHARMHTQSVSSNWSHCFPVVMIINDY